MGQLKIDLLNTNFTIQTNEDSEYLQKLYGYYKRIIEDVQKIDSIKNPTQIAILSGIMLCDELYKEKQNKVAMENGTYVPADNDFDKAELERKTLEMIAKIDKVL